MTAPTPRGEGTIDRRGFLRVSATAAGGLLIGVSLPGCGRDGAPGDGASGDAGPGANGAPAVRHALDGFLEIDTRGRPVIRIPVPEIGQGVRTSLAMLVAEELDVPWERVRVFQSEATDDMGPHPAAAGSQSVREHWLPFRRTGAAARDRSSSRAPCCGCRSTS